MTPVLRNLYGNRHCQTLRHNDTTVITLATSSCVARGRQDTYLRQRSLVVLTTLTPQERAFIFMPEGKAGLKKRGPQTTVFLFFHSQQRAGPERREGRERSSGCMHLRMVSMAKSRILVVGGRSSLRRQVFRLHVHSAPPIVYSGSRSNNNTPGTLGIYLS